VPTSYQSNAFSYLPADAPPWPTVIPEKTHAQNPETAALSTSQTKSNAKPKRSASTVLTMAAMILMVPLIGAALTMGALFAKGQIGNNNATPASAANAKTTANSAQPTATVQATVQPSTNQLPTPTSSKKISDADLNILLQYPDNWDPDQISKSTNDTTLDIHPHQQLPISFYVIHMTDTLSSQFQTVDDVNQARLQVMSQQQGITNVQPVQSTDTQPTIGGTKWATQEASFLVNGSNSFHLTIISTQRNKSYYTLMFWIPDVYYSEAMTKYIQPILQSIQFIK